MERYLGCNVSKIDVRDYKINSKMVRAAIFPESFELAKRMPVKSQGMVSSCVAHAMSSILEYHICYDKKLSTNFIYGIRSYLYNSKGFGMFLRDALNIVLKYGDMTYIDCPGNNEIEEVYDKAKAAFDNPNKLNRAAEYRIKSYALLHSNGDIKYALMNFGPVLISTKWYDKEEFNKEDDTITFDTESEYGYHALVLYGWNEKGWLCQNSWGNKWGNKGYFVLPYKYELTEAYSVIPTETREDEIIQPLNGKIWEIIAKILNKIVNIILKR